MATRAQARYEIKAIDRTKRVFRSIKQSLKSMKEQAVKTGLALTALGTAALVGTVAVAKKALEAAGALKTLSTQTGVSTRHLQRLQGIFARIGMEDNAPEVIKDIMEALGEAKREPGGTKADAFERLGIDPAKIKNAMQLFRQFSKAFARAKDKDLFLFDVREISNEAGDAIAAIGANFDQLAAKSKGTIFDQETIDAASKTLRQWRTLIFEITKSLQNGILNSGLMQKAQDAMTRISDVLGKQGVKGALAEVVNILIEEFPRATEAVFDAFVRIREVWKEIKATIDEAKIVMGGIGAAGRAVGAKATSMAGDVGSRAGVGGMIPVDPNHGGRVEKWLKGIFDNTRDNTAKAS